MKNDPTWRQTILIIIVTTMVCLTVFYVCYRHDQTILKRSVHIVNP